MSNPTHSVLYTGVTNNLARRVAEHRNKTGSTFTKRYNIIKLVYYESFSRIWDAIAAEKKIKAGSRTKKIKLIEQFNSEWIDLYEQSQD